MFQTTLDYSLFQKHPNNRQICQKNIEKIKNSIKFKNLLHLRPILVDSDYRIIDGQHRLEAAKQLLIPICYSVIKEATPSDIIKLNNNQKNWHLDDYLNYYCQEGLESYLLLRSFCEKKKLAVSAALTLFTNCNGNRLKEFREGEFELKNTFESKCVVYDQVENLIVYIRTIKMGNTKFLNQPKFLRCFLSFIARSDVDFEILRKKVEVKIDSFRACMNMNDYSKLFKDIYNYRNSNPIID
jgi:ParB-like nuclease domain